jgi:cytochrome c oxidase cbb3-type subunit III
MRTLPLLLSALLVLGFVIASGDLECSRPEQTVATHGAEIYGRMCSVCHGAAGEGYRADDAPALANQQFLSSVTDAYMRSAIKNGRTGTTMSAWSMERGGPLVSGDVDAVVAFVRTWQRAPAAKLDERPLSGDSARGSATWSRECSRCHGTRGTGGPQIWVGNPELLSTASNGFLRYAIAQGRPGTPMVSFDLTLGPSGTEDVIAYLRSVEAPVAAETNPRQAPPLPLGPVPLNPKGPEPVGFRTYPATTPADVIHAQLTKGAKMAILDARAPSDYSREHIAGAVSVPFYDPDPYVPDLPKNAWLVAYCACPHAESGTLAQKLTAKGFTKVTVLEEGLGVWKNRKYGTHTGDAP